MGLRIGEAVKVMVSDIDFRNKQIRVYAPKTGTIDFLPLHDKIYEILTLWVRNRQQEIEEYGGYLLFSDKQKTHRNDSTHLNDGFMRKVFKDYLKRAGLDDVYATIPSSGGQHGGPRKLYRLSTHSLRHYFITRVYKKTLNPVVTQSLARHRDFGTTQTYINLSLKDNAKAIKQAFEEPKIGEGEHEGDVGKIHEFLTFYEVWKKHEGVSSYGE